MKLAVSNIGWAPEKLNDVLPELRLRGVHGLVIAPTMVWQGAPRVEAKEAKQFRDQVESHGLVVAGMQSLTFGLDPTKYALSGDETSRHNLAEHLARQAELAGHLGAASLIFGSPGMRKAVNRDEAVEVFGRAAAAAADNGTTLCIEPLSGYGNNFITETEEGASFVGHVREAGATTGFGLHLDAAAVAGAEITRWNDPVDGAHKIGEAIQSVGVVSFDASAAELAPLTHDPSVPHAAYGKALSDYGYKGFVSLEMRQVQAADHVAALLREVDFMRGQYYASSR